MLESLITTAGLDLSRFRPTGGRLVVQLDTGVQVTPGGIFLPPSAQEIRSTGRVVATAPDCTGFEPGMHVLVDIHAGLQLGTLQNAPVNLYEPGDIQAVIEDAE